MTSPSPDIESLIATARERHYPRGDGDGTACRECWRAWPCPDRLLIDALVPVYEAAKTLASKPWTSPAGKPSQRECVERVCAIFPEESVRPVLGEPNA